MSLEEWFFEYSKSHQNKTNKLIHKICVPLITWSLMGILWTIPVPEFFLPLHLNWAYILVGISLLFYISLKSIKVIFCATLLIAPILILFEVYWSVIGHKLLYYSLLIFILAWIGQFIGHKIEGKKPSFLKDIQFLLIGPVWIFFH